MGIKASLCGHATRTVRRLLRVLERACGDNVRTEHSSTQIAHAFQVLMGACRARNRALSEMKKRAARDEKGILTDDAIVSILLAAAATEAFINEFAELIGVYRQNAADWARITPEMAMAADAIFELENAKESTSEKYAQAAQQLQRPFDRGQAPFQPFAQLLGLRGAIMHIKPPRPDVRHSGEKIADILAQQGIAITRNVWDGAWFDRLQTPDVAVWACKTAASMVHAMLDRVPHGPTDPFGPVYEHFHRMPFTRTDWGTDP